MLKVKESAEDDGGWLGYLSKERVPQDHKEMPKSEGKGGTVFMTFAISRRLLFHQLSNVGGGAAHFRALGLK